MADEVSSNSTSLPVSVLEHIDRMCLDFEAAWKAGRRPRIEDHLGALEGPERSAALRELVLLDIDYRSRSDEHPTEDEYRARFPQDSQPVSDAFRRLSTTETEDGDDPPPSTRLSGAQTIPSQFGTYELLEVLGQGGMGIVYRARQRTPDRLVAIKIIRPDWLAVVTPEQREKVIERFHAEAQAAAHLEHEHIVPVYEVGQVEGRPFFSMRYIQGRGLEELLRDRPLSGREAAALLEPIARALQDAHQHGIIHRDVKPRNILLDSDGKPYVVDFGLAKSLAEAQEITQTQDVIGTLAYMSPEQARAPASVDGRTDVYSLGATLYELVTGRPPFRAATPAETQRQVVENDPVPVRQLNPAVDRDLETICLKCLDKEPAQRYRSAEALGNDLARYLEGKAILARPLGIMARTIRWTRRRPAIAGLLSALAASLLIGMCISAYYAVEANKRAVEAEQRKREATESARIAREQEQVALDLAAIADDHRRRAEEQSRIADHQRETAERFLYAANIQLAQRALEEEKPWLMLKLLDALPRRASGNDLRGWEWYFLRGTAFGDRLTLDGHASLVDALAWSPDGRRLASTGPDENLRIWNMEGAPDVVIVPRTDRPSPSSSPPASNNSQRCRLSWSPDNKHLLVSSIRRLSPSGILVCEATTGQVVLRSDGGQGDWNHDGSKLGFVDAKARLRIWTPGAQDAREIPTHPEYPNVSECFAWRPDGSQYVLCALKGQLICVDANTHQPVATMNGQPSPVLVAWSPDGRQFATVSRVEIRLWEAASGQVKHTIKTPSTDAYDDAVEAVWSPNGQWLTIVDPDGGPNRAGLIKTWDARLATELLSVDGKAAAWNVDSSRFATVSGGLLTIWEAGTWKKISTLAGHLADGHAVAWQPNGSLVATGAGDRRVKIWDTNAAPSFRDLPGSRWVAWSPDGRLLAVLQDDNTIGVFDAATGQETLRWEGAAKPAVKWPWSNPMTWLGWSPDGTILAWCEVRLVKEPMDRAETSSGGAIPRKFVSKSYSHLFLFGAGGGELIHSIVMPGRAHHLAWCPRGERIAAANRDGDIQIFRVDDGETSLRIPDERPWDIAWSSDGRTLATSASGDIQLWDAQTGDKLCTFRDGDGALVSMPRFSHDGRRLAALGNDLDTRTRKIIVWDVPTGEVCQTIGLQDHSVLSLAWSPDNRRLVTAGTGEVSIWDAEIGQELLTFREPAESLAAITRSVRSLAVGSAAWSPDNRYLAVGSITGVKLWDSKKGHDNEAPIEPGNFRWSGYPIQSGGMF